MSEKRENVESRKIALDKLVDTEKMSDLLGKIYEDTTEGEVVRRFLRNNFAAESVGFLLEHGELEKTIAKMKQDNKSEEEIMQYENSKSVEIYRKYLHYQPGTKAGTGIGGEESDPLSSKELVNVDGTTFEKLLRNKLGDVRPGDITADKISEPYAPEALVEKRELFSTVRKMLETMIADDTLNRFKESLGKPINNMLHFLEHLKKFPKGLVTVNIPPLLSQKAVQGLIDALEKFKENPGTIDDLHVELEKIKAMIQKARKTLASEGSKSDQKAFGFYDAFMRDLESLEKNIRKEPEGPQLKTRRSL